MADFSLGLLAWREQKKSKKKKHAVQQHETLLAPYKCAGEFIAARLSCHSSSTHVQAASDFGSRPWRFLTL
jgi:hypothetical protein